MKALQWIGVATGFMILSIMLLLWSGAIQIGDTVISREVYTNSQGYTGGQATRVA